MHSKGDCKLTTIQIISSESVDDNFEQITTQLTQLPPLMKSTAHLVLLPENAICFANREHYLKSAEPLGNGPNQSRLSELAKRFNCTLICGSFPIKSTSEGKIHTTCLVYSPQGELIEHYNKIHLFDADVSDSLGAYRESDTFMAGNDVKVVDCGFAKIGLAICYDLRFPSLFQRLRELGAEIIVLPAAFTEVTGKAHWSSLLRARAIETQCYFIAANQGGEHFHGHSHFETRSTYGHSMIINEWGEIIVQLTTGNGFAQACFNKTQLENTRKQMPIVQHNQFNCIQKCKPNKDS